VEKKDKPEGEKKIPGGGVGVGCSITERGVDGSLDFRKAKEGSWGKKCHGGNKESFITRDLSANIRNGLYLWGTGRGGGNRGDHREGGTLEMRTRGEMAIVIRNDPE